MPGIRLVSEILVALANCYGRLRMGRVCLGFGGAITVPSVWLEAPGAEQKWLLLWGFFSSPARNHLPARLHVEHS